MLHGRVLGLRSTLMPALMALVVVACTSEPVTEVQVGEQDAMLTVDQLRDPSVQPVVATKDQSAQVTWAPLAGPLFDGVGPRFDDPSQHNVSDCLVLATLSGLAGQAPQH